MGDRVPLVSYLQLGGEPGEVELVANECTSCGARFFDRRVGCAACGAASFAPVALPRLGEVRTFTVVARAAPGIPVPFVAAVVDCGGTSVRANLVNVPPDPAHLRTGMAVRLVAVPVGVDAEGTEAVGFGFEPVAGPLDRAAAPTGDGGAGGRGEEVA